MAVFEEIKRLQETGTCEACHSQIGRYHMFWYGTKETKDGLLTHSTRLQYQHDGAFVCPSCVMESQLKRTKTLRGLYWAGIVVLLIIAIAAPILAGTPGLWVSLVCLIVTGALWLFLRAAENRPSFTSGSWLAWELKGKSYRQQGYSEWWDHKPRWFDT